MSATLTTLRDRVEQILQDETNAIWDTDALDEAIRLALEEYSAVRPYRTVGTISLTSDAREISLSTLTGLVDVTEVWADYTAADSEFPPNRRSFQHWKDEGEIYLDDSNYTPASGDVMRVFYTTVHTLNGLDSATANTFPDEDDETLIIGACAHAALVRSIDLTEQVTLGQLTTQQIKAWGMLQYQRFQARLKRLQSKDNLAGHAQVAAPSLDRWHRDTDWA